MTGPDITRLLHRLDSAEEGAFEGLMQEVYADLERIAARHLARVYGQGLPGLTLEPAALVNESFFKLAEQRRAYTNREHFFAIATRVMIRVLKDDQKRRRAGKRGGDRRPVTLLLDPPAAGPSPSQDLIAVDWLERLLDELEAIDPRKARLVELRVVFEHSMPEIAELLGVSLATVERDWKFVRAWILQRLEEGGEGRPGPAAEDPGRA